jgi:uncharacterized Zn-binding protein involved in type VI secretion
MGQPAAKQGDRIVAIDTHLVQPSGPTSPVPTPCPFSGPITGAVSANVLIQGQPAATAGSTATNTPGHVPPGAGTFVNPPTNRGLVISGSGTVLINGKAAARNGDTAQTCNDPVPMPVGTVVAASTVLIGG